jgi:hypothetical protein
MPALTSAAGLVGFLSEPDPTLQAFALERLNEEIDSVWTEVSGSIGQMYVLNIILDIQESSHAPWSCALAARLTS